MQKHVVLAVLFSAAGFLRLWNLGYSDYQGDEVKALYNPKEASSVRFFLEQRKGPMQFAVTAALKTFSPDYRNRLLLRFPFALAGLGSVIVFYYLAKLLFGDKIAFYSSIFFATNGFFIAFSRIVQYQSFVIFFGLLAVYLIYLSVHHLLKGDMNTTKPKSGYLLAGFVCWALSILSHYDGIFFGPIIFGILVNSFLRQKSAEFRKSFLKSLIMPMFVFLVLNGLFYVPFAMNIAKSTTDYWAGRISGEVSSKISSSRYLFSVYQPIYVLHIYTILGIMGFCLTAVLALYRVLPRLIGKLLFHAYKMETFNGAHLPFSFTTLLALLAWFLLPLMALEAIIAIPGTHIYTYLIPLFLLMGLAIFHVEIMVAKLSLILGSFIATKFDHLFASSNKPNFSLSCTVSKAVHHVFLGSVWLLFTFLTLQSYYVFVDHTYEYPWENKKFLIWTLPKPTPIFHLSMFGFPYYRHWDEIGDFIKYDGRSAYYTTNERVSIARHHISLEKDGQKAGYYIYILNPQTFTNEVVNERARGWMESNDPEKIYSNGARTVSSIYFIENTHDLESSGAGTI